jgi:hypothetical protein
LKTIYNSSINLTAPLIFKVVALALSLVLVELNILRAIDIRTQLLLLGIGLTCVAILNLDTEKGS